MSSDFYDIHVRPWLVAGRDLVPHRSFIQPLNAKDTTMTTSKRTALQRLADWDVATREMPKRKWARRAVAVGAANAVIFGGAMAYANWSTTGSGTGTAGTGTAKPVLLTTTGVTNPADLVPNGTGNVAVKVDNTVQATTGNNFAVQLTKVNTVSIAADDAANCPASNLSVNSALTPLPYTLPAAITVNGNTTTTASIANLVKLAANAPDTCQGKTFTITLTMS